MASTHKTNSVPATWLRSVSSGYFGLIVALLYYQLYNLKEDLKSEVTVAEKISAPGVRTAN